MSGPRRWGDPTAGIPGRRLFVALPLPDDAAAAVTEVVEEVRASGLPEGARDVRWVRLDGLHLTLRFLGPTLEPRVAPTAAAVVAAAAAAGPIELELGGAGTFPPGGRPRTIWIGVQRGAEAVDALSHAVSAALEPAGWPIDDRPFRPHLTLARSDGIAVGPLVASRLVAAMAQRRIVFEADRLGLYESVTGGGPARYVPVMVASLAARAGDGPDVYHRTHPEQNRARTQE
ncbi:MAG TPA: RNA 2',3'-cyclic phosphodiesterase [Candidatus Saccharimonadales bacterium]|nr:RNA 2',3'-cyclic phosphodiesterase [Candidatus Saccharimonadales bacterium]